MPYKFNDARRHKFKKKKYKITNWPAYNGSLRQRGAVTVWLSSEVEASWHAERRKTRGGQPTYSDLAITVCLTLGMVYKQPLRQSEGFVRSLVKLMGQARCQAGSIDGYFGPHSASKSAKAFSASASSVA